MFILINAKLRSLKSFYNLDSPQRSALTPWPAFGSCYWLKPSSSRGPSWVPAALTMGRQWEKRRGRAWAGFCTYPSPSWGLIKGCIIRPPSSCSKAGHHSLGLGESELLILQAKEGWIPCSDLLNYNPFPSSHHPLLNTPAVKCWYFWSWVMGICWFITTLFSLLLCLRRTFIYIHVYI